MKTKFKFPTILFLLTAGITMFFSTCKPDEVEPASEPTSFDILSGDNQTAEVETILPTAIEIFVKDQNGVGLEGVKISYEVTEGSVSSEEATTNSNGKTTVEWTLGSIEGEQTLLVTIFKTDGTTALSGTPFAVNATATYKTTVTDIDGNVYPVVKIGEQIWTAENLKVTHFPNGDEIELIEDNTAWAELEDNNTDKAYCFYNNNEAESYGALYTWAAATNGENSETNPSNVQGVCPDGWHLPSNAEWEELTEYLGGEYEAGGKLKATTSEWNPPNSGATNETGFTALPNGYRRRDSGIFEEKGDEADWWSATSVNDEKARISWVTKGNGHIINWSSGSSKSHGYSVRCIRDEQ